MSRRRIIRPAMSESEEWRIELMGIERYSYKGIARWIWGHGRANYEPSSAEVGRIGRVLRRAEIRVRDHRNCLTTEARRAMRDLDRIKPAKKAPRLRMSA